VRGRRDLVDDLVAAGRRARGLVHRGAAGDVVVEVIGDAGVRGRGAAVDAGRGADAVRILAVDEPVRVVVLAVEAVLLGLAAGGDDRAVRVADELPGAEAEHLAGEVAEVGSVALLAGILHPVAAEHGAAGAAGGGCGARGRAAGGAGRAPARAARGR